MLPRGAAMYGRNNEYYEVCVKYLDVFDRGAPRLWRSRDPRASKSCLRRTSMDAVGSTPAVEGNVENGFVRAKVHKEIARSEAAVEYATELWLEAAELAEIKPEIVSRLEELAAVVPEARWAFANPMRSGRMEVWYCFSCEILSLGAPRWETPRRRVMVEKLKEATGKVVANAFAFGYAGSAASTDVPLTSGVVSSWAGSDAGASDATSSSLVAVSAVSWVAVSAVSDESWEQVGNTPTLGSESGCLTPRFGA